MKSENIRSKSAYQAYLQSLQNSQKEKVEAIELDKRQQNRDIKLNVCCLSCFSNAEPGEEANS